MIYQLIFLWQSYHKLVTHLKCFLSNIENSSVMFASNLQIKKQEKQKVLESKSFPENANT